VKAVIYNRHSQDSGTGVSEDIQDPAMLALVKDRGGVVVATLPESGRRQSSFTLDRPEFKKGRAMLNAGDADTLVVPSIHRITRRRWHWEELVDEMDRNEWTVIALDMPTLDLRTPMGRQFAGTIVDHAEAQYRAALSGMNDARRNAVEKHGVHGGSDAPPGYSGWSVRGHAANGKALRGPLVKGPDAAKVADLLTRFVPDDLTGHGCASALGISLNSWKRMLTNDVYLGVARSGEFKKVGAHPALITQEVFDRNVDRVESQKVLDADEPKTATPRTKRALSKRVRCSASGRMMSYDQGKDKAGDLLPGYWRCKAGCRGKKECSCGGQSIRDDMLLPAAIEAAVEWHAFNYPLATLGREVDEATRTGLDAVLKDAKAVLASKEADVGQSLTSGPYVKAVEDAKTAIREHVISQGWRVRSEADVAALVASDSAEDIGQFLSEMLDVVVTPCGKHATKAARTVEARVQFALKTDGKPVPEETGAVAVAVAASLPEPVVSEVEARAVHSAR
jgi:DNA invertase Pin-like site-specific DNA recombinase